MTTRSGLPLRPPTPDAPDNEDVWEQAHGQVPVQQQQVDANTIPDPFDDIRNHIAEEVSDQLNECMRAMRDWLQDEFRSLLISPQEPQVAAGPSTSQHSQVPVDTILREAIPAGTQPVSLHPFKLKPKPYDGGVDWESYKVQFEMVAVSNGWSSDTKATVLGSMLCGPALTLLSELQ